MANTVSPFAEKVHIMPEKCVLKEGPAPGELWAPAGCGFLHGVMGTDVELAQLGRL